MLLGQSLFSTQVEFLTEELLKEMLVLALKETELESWNQNEYLKENLEKDQKAVWCEMDSGLRI